MGSTKYYETISNADIDVWKATAHMDEDYLVVEDEEVYD